MVWLSRDAAGPGNAPASALSKIAADRDMLADRGEDRIFGDRAPHDIFERLAEADPGNAGWQRDLSVSQDRIGDVQVEQGDLAAALTSYRLLRPS
jgi:hypothetical protein